ncbi:G protein pathway suppressor 2 isoform A [Alligator mississippiensis]|uniref:G protein pathway suppressor 2 isoform A n=1 Tax=Alligator mississippiensis TaxID=8496 RepID=A0A151N138_ALLMI|nr:G protein pathway suppressor 2 isoform A [Alligator mississippiensis]
MPALLERPKLSSAMARALHRHVMVERERKRQASSPRTGTPPGLGTILPWGRGECFRGPPTPLAGEGAGPVLTPPPTEEEEVDKMMEQKMKEEQERRRKKEMEERMSLEETREQILKLQEKLSALQEEKHQLFLQLKKVLHEEEKRRRKEQSDMTTLTAAAYQQGMAVHAGAHLLNMQGFIPPSTSIPLQKQLEHANQQSGFSDSALHPSPTLLPVQMPAATKSGLAYSHPARPASPGSFPHGSTPQQPHTSGFPASSQPPTRHPFIQHGQGQRFYHK